VDSIRLYGICIIKGAGLWGFLQLFAHTEERACEREPSPRGVGAQCGCAVRSADAQAGLRVGGGGTICRQSGRESTAVEE
jgi:hypothetical protein